jgi:hypothetical protein
MKISHLLIPVTVLALACSNTRVPVEESPDHIASNPAGEGAAIEVEMIRGTGHNHPLMAIWAETPDGMFIQTLYVAESIAKGVFQHGDPSRGFWMPGEIQRPAALPYWAHSRGIKNAKGLYLPTPTSPIPDAYTGPTPDQGFILHTKLDRPGIKRFNLLFEINQTWDWNEFWTNDRFPEDEEYKTSCQPALVYSVTVDMDQPQRGYQMKVIGRSHHSGATGELFTDLESLTTALHIAEQITITVSE